MRVHRVLLCVLLAASTSLCAMRQGGFLVPTNFRLQTALDEVTVAGVCQTLTFAAGIAMFYHAGNALALAQAPLGVNGAPLAPQELTLLRRSYKRKALCSFFVGCFFVAAGFVQRHHREIIHVLRRFAGRLAHS